MKIYFLIHDSKKCVGSFNENTEFRFCNEEKFKELNFGNKIVEIVDFEEFQNRLTRFNNSLT